MTSIFQSVVQKLPRSSPIFSGWVVLLSSVTATIMGCGGGSSASTGSTAVTPIFYNVTAASLKVGVASTLTVTGANLPLSATLTLSSGTCAAPTGNTANGFSIVCTPGSDTLGASATVWSAAVGSGGWWLGQKLLTVAAATPTAGLQPLNDTGITPAQCFQAGSDNLVSCTSATALALNDKQDGMVGRDVDFADNADGFYGASLGFVGAVTDCVKDKVTGLTWQRASNTLSAVSYANFIPDLAQLVSNANATTLCGLSNWRVPTWLEFQSLVLFSAPFTTGATDMDWLPLTKSTWYHALNNSWTVDFRQGATTSVRTLGLKGYVNEVRLVSGGVTAPAVRFTPSADGTEVLDTLSGLTWRRCSEGQTWSGTTCTGVASVFTHEAALTHAKSQSTWRLPNVKELSSLIDESVYNPAIDTTIFASTPVDSPAYGVFWSATPVVVSGNPRSSQAWSVGFYYNRVDPLNRSDTVMVRLVR